MAQSHCGGSVSEVLSDSAPEEPGWSCRIIVTMKRYDLGNRTWYPQQWNRLIYCSYRGFRSSYGCLLLGDELQCTINSIRISWSEDRVG